MRARTWSWCGMGRGRGVLGARGEGVELLGGVIDPAEADEVTEAVPVVLAVTVGGRGRGGRVVVGVVGVVVVVVVGGGGGGGGGGGWGWGWSRGFGAGDRVRREVEKDRGGALVGDPGVEEV